MENQKIEICRLFENTSKNGKTYLVGNLSFTSKLLLLRNEKAQAGEPAWVAFLVEKPPKGAN